MRRCQRRFLAVLLIEILLLGGCAGSATQDEIPELMEPVSVNAAFRPVELRTIGETQVLYGTVVPMEYCSFYDTAVEIEEIMVAVGDYVEQGDIVAYADSNKAREELDSLKLQMENLTQNYAFDNKIGQLQMLKTASEYEEKICRLEMSVSGNDVPDVDSSEADWWDAEDKTVSGNDVSGNDAAEMSERLQTQKVKELNVAQENLYYDEILYQYRMEQLQEKIDSKQRIVRESSLRASHSGYVVYTKQLGLNTSAEAYENIVVVADSEENYIELTDTTIRDYDYEDYEVKYLNYAGEKYAVTELPYSTEVQALAQAGERFPNVRLLCPQAPKLTVGETYPILYREKESLEVPVIGLDSLQGEAGAYFVYIKGDQGEREKRFVTIGESDKYYVQILDGLAEGDLVYYESEARMPVAYREYTVEYTDYTIDNVSRSYRLADEQPVWYNAEGDGVITEFAVKVGDEVEKGDLLYVLLSEVGKAAPADARNQIHRENITYEKNMERLEKSLHTEGNAYGREILILQKEQETINHAYRLRQLEENYNRMQENNQNGEIRVYAKESGTIMRIPVREYHTNTEKIHVVEDTKVLSVGRKAEDRLLVEMVESMDAGGRQTETNYPDNIAEFGENITITTEQKEYKGTCIGWAFHEAISSKRHYGSETEEGPVISFCTSSGYRNPSFYVEMEEDFYENMPKGKVTFSYVSMESVILIPTALVKEEANAKNPARKDNYVWRLVGDELVKQYVIVQKAYSDENYTLILSGVEAQDVLAWEK